MAARTANIDLGTLLEWMDDPAFQASWARVGRQLESLSSMRHAVATNQALEALETDLQMRPEHAIQALRELRRHPGQDEDRAGQPSMAGKQREE